MHIKKECLRACAGVNSPSGPRLSTKSRSANASGCRRQTRGCGRTSARSKTAATARCPQLPCPLLAALVLACSGAALVVACSALLKCSPVLAMASPGCNTHRPTSAAACIGNLLGCKSYGKFRAALSALLSLQQVKAAAELL